jgi:serine/threonine-protein phosphatase 2B regulatory subunit
MLTQYDIEEVQAHIQGRFTQHQIVALYERFCALDRTGKGYITSDEFMSIPEFALNPLAQRLLRMLEGVNFKDFVGVLSKYSPHASPPDKAELIFRVYDTDDDGRVSREDIEAVLKDLSGTFLTDEQRQQVLDLALQEGGFSTDCSLALEDFVKVLGNPNMVVEIPTY